MQYSLFSHGTTLQVETPENLASVTKLGWGTEIVFKPPVLQYRGDIPINDDYGQGSWFHIALPSTLTTFGRKSPQLKSVTLLFETVNCRITLLHLWDKATFIQGWGDMKGLAPWKLQGNRINHRNLEDLNPEVYSSYDHKFDNTVILDKPHRVYSAINIAFFACWRHEDFKIPSDPHFNGPYPPSILTVAGAGGQFIAKDWLFSFDRIRRSDWLGGLLYGP